MTELPRSRFARPAGSARDVLAWLDDAGLGVARARAAARLGAPDPFDLRAALAALPGDAPVVGQPGATLDADAADAALVAAGACPELAGIFAGRAPGPRTRGVPVDGGAHPWLRWPTPDPPAPPRLGAVRSWSTAEIGDDPTATVRCATALADGTAALGSDHGLVLAREGRAGPTFAPFAWPAGARREARRVEAMAEVDGALVIATTQALFRRDRSGRVTSQRHPPDDEGGSDEIGALHADHSGGLLVGWRTRTERRDARVGNGVQSGVRDVLSFAADPSGVVYAGTRQGQLWVVDGAGPGVAAPIRRWASPIAARDAYGTGRSPVRYLTFAAGALWAAVGGETWRFDGATWSAHAPEAVDFAVDGAGRLWALAEGGLWWWDGARFARADVALERPWCLAALPGALWIGGKERVWRVGLG